MRAGTVGVAMVILAAFPAAAQQAGTAGGGGDIVPGTVSGSATIATDYVFRGISQTDENPSVQGLIEWRHDTGVLLGVWGSNVDFNDGDQASLELDWYVGFTGTTRAIGYDVRFIYYSYPGADVARDYDFWEVGGSLTHEPLAGLTLGVGYNFSPDYFAESGAGHYVHGDAAYAIGMLPVPVRLTGTVGYQFIDDNDAFGSPDYWHWSAGIAVDVQKLSLGLVYHDTDIEKSRCGAGTDVCGARVVASGSYAF